MKKEELKITVYNYDNPSELNTGSRKLLEIAKEATQRAWAPYSRFKVGAALELENGEIITGTNQENVAFPSGLCAERVALFYAASRYPDLAVKRIAIAAFADGQFIENPIFPCGSCRQVMLEYENRVKLPMEVIMHGTLETKVVNSARALLPLPFDYDLAT